MAEIPIIETPRLILRPHRASDFDDCFALWSDPWTVRFIGGQVQEAQAVWFRMLRYAGMWALVGYGYWAFEEKDTGRFVGEGGLSDSRRGIRELEGLPEIGWALAADVAGRGLATEAARAIAHWADTGLRAPKTGCIIEPGNAASLRVAAKCGYSETARIDYDGTDMIVLKRRALVEIPSQTLIVSG